MKILKSWTSILSSPIQIKFSSPPRTEETLFEVVLSIKKSFPLQCITIFKGTADHAELCANTDANHTQFSELFWRGWRAKEKCGITDACRGELSIGKGLKGLLLNVQGQGTIKRLLSVGAWDRDWGNLVEDGQKIDQGLLVNTKVWREGVISLARSMA